ncbi:major outer capsid [Pulau reovirus]|uniref:Major outer capsid n=1 Tax=Pulau reovirus TaxID=253454 RepID=G4WUF7_9REOV|nr:major outer capsid [Pulau reovirus]AEQ49378.1 major outer capsid [Pulau reovirus]
MMGNATSIVQNFNIKGDGNTFSPSAETASSAVPSLSLNPGLLNPGGKAWTLIDPTVPATAPGSLRLMTTEDVPAALGTSILGSNGAAPSSGMYLVPVKETLNVVTDHAIAQFEKLQSAYELDRDYLDEKGVAPESVSFKNYLTYVDCYVGVSARQAATNFQKHVPVVTKSKMMSFMTSAQNILSLLGPWEKSIREVLTMLPSSTPYGTLKCDMKAIVAMLEEQLPEGNLCRLYPQAAACSIARRNGGVRWKEPNSDEAPSLATNDVAASTMGALANTTPLADKSNTTEESMRLVSESSVDLICSRRPISASVWARTVEPKSYNIRTLKVSEALWLRQSQVSAGFDVAYNLNDSTQRHFWITTGTTVINLEQTGSMMFEVNIEGKDYKKGNFQPNGATLVLLVMQSRLPFETWTVSSQIEGIAQVASIVVTAGSGSTVNTSIIGSTSLSYLFERETITTANTEVNTYLLCTWQSSSICTDADSWPDAWDAVTTLTPLTTGTVTVKGSTVEKVTPVDLIGSYTPESLTAALPNDAGNILALRAETLAKAVKNEDDSVTDESSPFSAPIQGILALQQKETEGTAGTPDLKPPGTLQKIASRAMHMFLGDPKSVLKQTTPVLKDPQVWTSFVQGVRDGIRNKSLSAGVRSIVDNLSAVQSVKEWKQNVLGKIQKLFKPK